MPEPIALDDTATAAPTVTVAQTFDERRVTYDLDVPKLEDRRIHKTGIVISSVQVTLQRRHDADGAPPAGSWRVVSVKGDGHQARKDGSAGATGADERWSGSDLQELDELNDAQRSRYTPAPAWVRALARRALATAQSGA